MFRKILDAFHGQLPPDIIPSFENTGDEDERTLDFLHEIETRWHPIVWLEYDDVFDVEDYRNSKGKLVEKRLHNTGKRFRITDYQGASRKGEPFDKMIAYYAAYRQHIKTLPPVLPNPPQRMCTANLKIKLPKYYMLSIGYDYFDAIMGIRADEPKRYASLSQESGQRYAYVMPMFLAGVTKEQVLEFWARQPFDLQMSPGAEEGNCRYCFLKKESKLVTIMRKFAEDGAPDKFLARMIQREQVTGQRFRNDRSSYAEMWEKAKATVDIKDQPGEVTADCVCGVGSDV
jgi:hypothetical protein